MEQTGDAVATRQFFLSELVSHTTEAFTAFNLATTPDPITPAAPITILGGLGTLQGLEDPTEAPGSLFYSCNLAQGGGNGRFNTSADTTAPFLETSYGFEILLSSSRTAFSCYMNDMGEANSAEVEFRFYLGSTMVRAVHCPTDLLYKPSSNSVLFFGFADSSVSFDKIEARVRGYHTNPSQEDYVGFDDLTVGVAPTGTTVQPSVFHGANTVADAAQTVTGHALAARNSWLAAAGGGAQTADFESVATGGWASMGSGGLLTLPFSGTGLSGATISYTAYSGSSTSPNYMPGTPTTGIPEADVKATNSTNRWNTTSGGSKYLEWCEEILITLPTTRTKLGFYLTNIGNQNCTIRVMLLGPQVRPFDVLTPAGERVPRWGGPCYYVPKGAELISPAGLLRFWGVVDELPFDRIILQTIFYDSLSNEKRILPPSFGGVSYARIGIDDIMVA